VIILRRKTGIVPIELMPGLVLDVVPARPVDFDHASAVAGRHVARILAGDEGRARYGLGDEAEAIDAATAFRMNTVGMAIELGVRHIKGWRGLADDGGDTPPVDEGSIAMLFNEWAPIEPGHVRRSLGQVFLERMQELDTLERAAKKDSAASSDGTTGAALTGAENVTNAGTAAP